MSQQVTAVEPGSTDRIVSFEQLCNFRSVGGLVTADSKHIVRHGILFRSAKFDNITESDLKRLMDSSSPATYVKTIVDLRDYSDAAADKMLVKQNYQWESKVRHRRMWRDVSKHGHRHKTKEYQWFNIPILTLGYKLDVFRQTPKKGKLVVSKAIDAVIGTNNAVQWVSNTLLNQYGLRGLYKDMLKHSRKTFREVLNFIVNSQENNDAPVAIHCEHGKDRTGLVVMLIYACCGVSSQAIIDDYALSWQGLEGMREEMQKEMVERNGMIEEYIETPPEVMRDTLLFIDVTYGSVSEYLTHIGFGPEDQEKLRTLFLVEYQQS